MNPRVADVRLSPDRFDAAVLDLDGVLTRTAKVHAAAWKTTFDEYLAERASAEEPPEPFDAEKDYREYVDGKPRYDGVRSFLEARGIDLPYGDPDDPPGRKTICGLGNRKNALFREKLRVDGVEVYDSSVVLVRALREAGMRTAVVSSSRNCAAVVEAAGLPALFDARVDGTDLEQLGLAGKPAPDMFLEACRRLDCDPQRAIGIEDATAGVAAAKAAGFGYVIGIDRDDRTEALRAQGADRVVRDLSEVRVVRFEQGLTAQALPSALEHLDEILPGDDLEPALFLDYDGTLTAIVDQPDEADLDEGMRAILQQLSERCELAVISGRDLADVRDRVGIAGIWYAGSHGFDIAGPEGERTEYQEGTDFLPILDAAEERLREELGAIPGCLVERKRFSIAVHYRQVEASKLRGLDATVEHIHADFPKLRRATGKKIYELQPAIDWDKGKALHWLMQTLDMDLGHFVPIYIGDDETDEDAFRELEEAGVGILVSREDRPTRASYRLADPNAVERFLRRLVERLEGGAL